MTSEGSLPEDEESSASKNGRGEEVETSTTPDLQSEKIQNEGYGRRRSSRLKKDLGPVHDKGRTRIACAKIMSIMHRSTRAKDLQDEGWKIQVAKKCEVSRRLKKGYLR